MSDQTTFAFGSQRAAEYVPPAGDTVWIRYFKDPITTLRVIPMVGEDAEGSPLYGVEAWYTEREHYEDGIGSYVCVERFGAECRGCKSNNEKVRQRKRQYYFNAYDDKGVQRIFKCGTSVYKILKARQQRKVALTPDNKQPISEYDLIVSKTGRGFDTLYDVEPGDVYPVEWPDAEDMLDIPQALQDAYNEAMEAYNGNRPLNGSKPAADEPAAGRQMDAASSPLAKAAKAPEAQAADGGALPAVPTPEQLEDAELPDLKAWLTANDVEFPANAPRSRVYKLAVAKLEELTPNF